MSNLALHEAIAAACPIVGVAIGDPADRSTWRINFAAEATKEQAEAAQAVLLAFDMVAADGQAAILAELQANDAASVRSLREWAAAQPGAPKLIADLEATAVTLRTRLKA